MAPRASTGIGRALAIPPDPRVNIAAFEVYTDPLAGPAWIRRLRPLGRHRPCRKLHCRISLDVVLLLLARSLTRQIQDVIRIVRHCRSYIGQPAVLCLLRQADRRDAHRRRVLSRQHLAGPARLTIRNAQRLTQEAANREVWVNRWSEKLLVRRILAGDREACRQLILLHHQAIYRLLVHLCRDAHTAEDLTQETFAAAWTGLGTFSGTASLATWLHRIAYRKFVDAGRRRQVVPVGQPDQAIEQVPSNEPDALDEVLADERSRRLYQALARLEPAERDVVVLHYLQGLSYREMAEVLDEPSGTVKWRTSQALTRLKTLLEGRLEDETEPTKTQEAPEPRNA